LLLYETPNLLSPEECANIKTQLSKFKKNKTILFFSRDLEWADVCDKVIEIEGGRVTSISVGAKP
jgi:ABC-type transport system involved in cytochrome bd biosynthesis fused ATPase/permease subunit